MEGGYAGPQQLRRLLEAVMSIGSELDLAAVLRRITEAATALVDATYGALGVLDESGTRLEEFITVGVTDKQRRAIGDLPHGHGILGLLIVEPKPLRLPDLHEHPDRYGFPPNHPPMTSFLGVPLLVRDTVFGNLYLTDKHGGEVFTDIDEELVVALAAAAGVAIENARLHAKVAELVLLEDRERIARDLHDTVIQRLFATGLALQGTVPLARVPEVVDRIQTAVDDIDTTIREIRSAIFELEAPPAARQGLRRQVLDVATEASRSLGFDPIVRFDGPIDSATSVAVGEHVLAVLREALSNVARHAAARSAEVEVRVGGAPPSLTLEIRDDGKGVNATAETGGRGLANMEARAESLDGTLSLEAPASGGTLLRWTVPLEPL